MSSNGSCTLRPVIDAANSMDLERPDLAGSGKPRKRHEPDIRFVDSDGQGQLAAA
jgi:hypothetical protein